MNFKLQDLAHLLQGTVEGNADVAITGLSELLDAQPGDISFLHNPKYENQLYETKASAVLVSKKFEPKQPLQTVLVRVGDPYTAFAMLLEEYQRLHSFAKEGIEQPSFVHPTAKVGEKLYIGAFAYIGEGSEVGEGTKIYPQVYVGENVRIGKHCVIYPGAKIHHGTEIGDYCVINAGAVIGSDGFGFAPQRDGSYRAIPQVGKVILEDHVRIGANTVIDRATVSATVVGQGSKLDNLIQIAHNCRIGRHTVMAAQVGLAGSSTVGSYCMLGGQVGLAGHLSIADKTRIGAQAGVMSSIETQGTAIIGSPAFDFKEQMKTFVVYRRLPELQKRIEALEKKVLA
jgi:UDP-3-O-[3-hydroxymyristoyl] glucosamine N-acyltransferase